MPYMPKKINLHQVKINNENDLEKHFSTAMDAITNADNVTEHQFIISLTDAEKLVLHLALQTAHVMAGSPRTIEAVMTKAVNMEKVSNGTAGLN